MLPLPAPIGAERRKSWLERGSDFVYRPIERLYSGVLAFCLRRRWVVGLAILASFALTVPMCKSIGGDFLPPNDEAQFEIYVQTPEGTSLEATTLVCERLARKAHLMPEVDHTLVSVADSDRRRIQRRPHLCPPDRPETRKRNQNDVMAQVRKDVLAVKSNYPEGTRVAAQPVNDFSIGGQNANISYVISGPDLAKLERYGKSLRATMEARAKQIGIVDLDTSLLDPVDETTVVPDLDRAALLGVEPADITSALSVLVGGAEVSNFEQDGDQYEVFVRALEIYRNDPRALELIGVPSKTLGQVPLTDVITISAGKANSKITRQSRERAVTITMNNSPGYSESAIVAELEKAIKALNMPPEYSWAAFGRSKEFAKLGPAFLFAIGLAIIFMYLVLAAQFESLPIRSSSSCRSRWWCHSR